MYAVKRLRYPAYTWFTLQQISGRLLAFAKSALGRVLPIVVKYQMTATSLYRPFNHGSA
jgi:hypothetical protein